MATTLQGLKTYYGNVMRSDFAHIPATHQTLLANLSTQVDGGALTLAAAQSQVVRLAVDTTSVASLAYNFFTGSTPFHTGFDYLVSAGGPNANNLNSAYYQAFNVENRYINFALNLGKAGEGATWFGANYGALTMAQTVAKAYAEIFGVTPTSAKIDELLNSQVPDGKGGTYTRNAYLATYGGDGLDGIGTKAALIGWLLAASAKEDVGTYAKANDAFLADLATDGVAFFRGELVTVYGTPSATPGATLSATGAQSISPTAMDAALKSTAGDDTITVTGDLAAGQTIDGGAGRDKITVTGMVQGRVTADGGDTVTLKGGLATGGAVTATGASNTLHIQGTAFYQGEVSGFQSVYLHGSWTPTIKGASVIYDVVNDPAITGRIRIDASHGELVVLKDTPHSVSLGATVAAGVSPRIDVHLQNYMGAPTTEATSGIGYTYNPNGGAILFYADVTEGAIRTDGTLALHVDTDSTAGVIAAFARDGYDLYYRSQLPNLIIDGAGKLTAQIASSFVNVDASRAGDLNLTYTSNLYSKEQVFRLGDGTNNLRIFFSGGFNFTDPLPAAKFYLGAGVDTISLGAGGADTAAAASGPGLGLTNLATVSGVVSATPELIGFQKGVDHLVLDTQIHAITANVQAYADGKATLQDALVAVSAHVAANTGAVFSWGGDTYVYAQDGQAGVNVRGGTGADITPIGDGLIKLVGVTGLTVGTGAGSYDIHYG